MTMFLHMGLKHNLNTILRKRHLKEEYSLELKSEYIPPPKNESYNNFVDHYNVYKERNKDFSVINKLLPNGAVFLAAVRDPFARFLSRLAFKDSHEYDKIRRAAQRYGEWTGLFPMLRAHPNLIDHSQILAPNAMMKYFGMEGGHDDSSKVDTFLDGIFRKFQFIILVEFYDESIILLKRRMCWRLEDVLYSKHHVDIYSKELDASRYNEQFCSWFEDRNYADMRLYNETVSRFKSELQHQEQDFFEEVKQFRKIISLVINFCQLSQNTSLVIPHSTWNANFTITTDECVLLMASETEMREITAITQYLKLKK